MSAVALAEHKAVELQAKLLYNQAFPVVHRILVIGLQSVL